MAEIHVVRITEPVTITFLFELIPLKCIYLHRGYFRLIKKYQSARVQIAVAGIKTLNSLQIIKIGQRFLLVRQFCCTFFERNPIFFLFASFCFFFAQSFSLRRLLHSVYTVPLRSHTNVISVHTLERLLMH